MSEGWNIAVLGATGAVGEALLDTLAERQFPVGRSMRWRAMIARESICVLAVSR
jgi:aspartate-semialdehyde dehydrogenase